MTGNPKIDRCIDALCADGCRAVRDYITALHAGRELPQYADLDSTERALLRDELESIMSVYGDNCRV